MNLQMITLLNAVMITQIAMLTDKIINFKLSIDKKCPYIYNTKVQVRVRTMGCFNEN